MPPTTPTLENWHTGGDPRVDWIAPGGRPLVLCGKVYGHVRQPDGVQVVTTPIMEATGREVVTASGTRYQLGAPSPAFVAWLQERGRTFDPEQPVKVGKSLEGILWKR